MGVTHLTVVAPALSASGKFPVPVAVRAARSAPMRFLPPSEPVHGRTVASLPERVGAHVIDVLLQAMVQITIAVLIAWEELSGLVFDAATDGDVRGLVERLELATAGALLVSIVLAWLVGGALEVLLTARFGGSVGKILLGLEVVDASTGRRLPSRRVVLRWLGLGWAAPAGLVTPAAQFVPFAGYGLAWFDPRRAALHDRLSGALVLRLRPRPAQDPRT